MGLGNSSNGQPKEEKMSAVLIKRQQKTGTNQEIPPTELCMPQKFTWFPTGNWGDLKLPCSLVIPITAKKEDRLGVPQSFQNRIVCLE